MRKKEGKAYSGQKLKPTKVGGRERDSKIEGRVSGVGKYESEKWYWQKSDHGGLVGYGQEFGIIQRAVKSHWKVEVEGALKQ